MPMFAYTVCDTGGKRMSGILMADDRDAAVRILVGRDLIVARLSLAASAASSFLRKLGIGAPAIRSEQIVTLTQQLAAMLEAGVTLYSAVEVISRETREPLLRDLVLEMAASLSNGKSLTEVLESRRDVFSEQYIAMVAAGETGGKLAEILRRLAHLLEEAEMLRRKIRAATYYPAFVTSFAVLVVAGILAFGVPRFEAIYTGFGAELPVLTKLVVVMGRFLGGAWPFILVAMGIGAAVLRAWVRTETGRYQWDLMKLRAPILGPLLQRLAIANFSRTMATLYGAGVPLLDTMELVARSMDNAVLEAAVRNCASEVREGASILGPLRSSGWFTEMALSMLAAGETTGALDRMLDHVAQYYESQVEIALKGMMSLLEPVIIVFVGVAIGFIVIAMMLPIFNLASIVMK